MNAKIGLQSDELIKLIQVFCKTIEQHKESINALNVFPVPDGDTGTNMFFTLRGILDYLQENKKDLNLSSLVALLSKGALLSARGNSGLLLAQIFKGLAFALKENDYLGPKQFVNALMKSTEFAYQSISEPKEGTILTVLKQSAHAAAENFSRNPYDLIQIWQVANNIAKKTVDDTPNQMELLKKAGVVDAGGYGLSLMLEASLNCLSRDEKGDIMFSIPKDESLYIPEVINQKPIRKEFLQSVEDESWGFCTSFVINGNGSALNVDQIKIDLNDKGKSLVITGDPELIKIHIHVENPEELIKYSEKYGNISHQDIQNMNDQTSRFNHLQNDISVKNIETALIIFAQGSVLRQRFVEIIPDYLEFIEVSENSTPSVQDILYSLENSKGENIILLSNHKDLIGICNQAIELSKKKVSLISTKNFIEGISAVLAYSSVKNFDLNIKSMNRAIEDIKTCFVKVSVKDVEFDGLHIKKGDFIGIIEDEIMAKSGKKDEVLKKIMARIDIKQRLVSVYTGNNIIMEDAVKLLNNLQEQFKETEFDLIDTGQYDSEYFIGIE